ASEEMWPWLTRQASSSGSGSGAGGRSGGGGAGRGVGSFSERVSRSRAWSSAASSPSTPSSGGPSPAACARTRASEVSSALSARSTESGSSGPSPASTSASSRWAISFTSARPRVAALPLSVWTWRTRSSRARRAAAACSGRSSASTSRAAFSQRALASEAKLTTRRWRSASPGTGHLPDAAGEPLHVDQLDDPRAGHHHRHRHVAGGERLPLHLRARDLHLDGDLLAVQRHRPALGEPHHHQHERIRPPALGAQQHGGAEGGDDLPLEPHHA